MTETMKRACLAAVAGVLLIAAVVLLMVLLPGNTAAASDDAGAQTSVEANARARAEAEAVERDIERVQDAIFNLRKAIDASKEEYPMLIGQSNPGVYIADGRNTSYNTIIEVGPVGLPVLERALMGSNRGGLEDFIICIAVLHVSGVNVQAVLDDLYPFATPGEFRSLWPEIRSSASDSINRILASKQLSNQEKMERISAYGLLAVPIIKDALLQGSFDAGLVSLLNDYLADRPLTEYEINALR